VVSKAGGTVGKKIISKGCVVDGVMVGIDRNGKRKKEKKGRKKE